MASLEKNTKIGSSIVLLVVAFMIGVAAITTPAQAWGGNHKDVCYLAWDLLKDEPNAKLGTDCGSVFVDSCLVPDEYGHVPDQWSDNAWTKSSFIDQLGRFGADKLPELKKAFLDSGYLDSAKLEKFFITSGYEKKLGMDENPEQNENRLKTIQDVFIGTGTETGFIPYIADRWTADCENQPDAHDLDTTGRLSADGSAQCLENLLKEYSKEKHTVYTGPTDSKKEADWKNQLVKLEDFIKWYRDSGLTPKQLYTLTLFEIYGVSGGTICGMHGNQEQDKYMSDPDHYYCGAKLLEEMTKTEAYGNTCGREFVIGTIMHTLEDSHVTPHNTEVDNKLGSQDPCHAALEDVGGLFFGTTKYRTSGYKNYIYEPYRTEHEGTIVGYYGAGKERAGYLTMCNADCLDRKNCEQPEWNDALDQCWNQAGTNGICNERVDTVDLTKVGIAEYENRLDFNGEGVDLPRTSTKEGTQDAENIDNLGAIGPAGKNVMRYWTPVDISYRSSRDQPETAKEEYTQGNPLIIKNPVIMEESWSIYQTMLLNVVDYMGALTGIFENGPKSGDVGCALGTSRQDNPTYKTGMNVAIIGLEYVGNSYKENGRCSCSDRTDRPPGATYDVTLLNGKDCASPVNCANGAIDVDGVISAAYSYYNVPLLSYSVPQCLGGEKVTPVHDGTTAIPEGEIGQLMPGDILCFVGGKDGSKDNPQEVGLYVGGVTFVKKTYGPDSMISQADGKIAVTGFKDKNDFLWAVRYPIPKLATG